MASYLDKTVLPVAVQDNNKFDMGSTTIMTSDFFNLRVSRIQELVPGSKIDLTAETFVRLQPLPVPTFGRAMLHTRCYKVPFKTLFRGWEDYIVNTVHHASDGISLVASVIDSIPTVTNYELQQAFLNSVGTTQTGTTMLYTVSSNPDVVEGNNLYRFTSLGAACIANLEGLGYKINWEKSDLQEFSALPLLALARVYVDFYYPSQYTDTAVYDYLMGLLNQDLQSGARQLSAMDVLMILQSTSTTMYDSDLFVSAFDRPNSPNASYVGDFKIVNIDTLGQVYSSSTNTYSVEKQYVTNNSGAPTVDNRLGGLDAPFIGVGAPISGASNNATTFGGISEYLLHALSAMSSWVKRNQLSSARAFERYLSRYGKALSPDSQRRCTYLGAVSQEIKIGDIVSTTDNFTQQSSSTSPRGAHLGAYAGKGMSYGKGGFQCSSDEDFCYVLVLQSIVPAVSYTQGIDPLCRRIGVHDYFQPEYDGLAVEALPSDSLYIPQFGGYMQGNPHEQVFGYVPRYATYKSSTCMDRLLGNFRVPSISGGTGLITYNAADSWYLNRMFKLQSFQSDYANCVHSLNFVVAGDAEQYKRIFYGYSELEPTPDNFTIVTNYECAMYAPMKKLYDEYDFPENGKKVTLEVNGVKQN